MLTLIEKVNFFEKFLLSKNHSYSDQIKDILYEYYFEINRNNQDINDFLFLNIFNTTEDIKIKTEFLISKIIMNEHQDGIDNLIHEYGFSNND